MTKPTKEQKGIWLNEFYEWYKDCFSIDGDMAEQVKTQMFADMRYAYIAAKKSDLEELQKTEAQLCGCRDGVASLKKEIDEKIDSYLELNKELQKTREQLEKAEKAIGQIDKIIESDNFEGYSDAYNEKRNVIDRYFKDKQGE